MFFCKISLTAKTFFWDPFINMRLFVSFLNKFCGGFNRPQWDFWTSTKFIALAMLCFPPTWVSISPFCSFFFHTKGVHKKLRVCVLRNRFVLGKFHRSNEKQIYKKQHRFLLQFAQCWLFKFGNIKANEPSRFFYKNKFLQTLPAKVNV